MHKMDSSAPVIGYIPWESLSLELDRSPQQSYKRRKFQPLYLASSEESLISLLQLKNSQGTFISESILTFSYYHLWTELVPKCSHKGKVTGYCLGGYQ